MIPCMLRRMLGRWGYARKAEATVQHDMVWQNSKLQLLPTLVLDTMSLDQLPDTELPFF